MFPIALLEYYDFGGVSPEPSYGIDDYVNEVPGSVTTIVSPLGGSDKAYQLQFGTEPPWVQFNRKINTSYYGYQEFTRWVKLSDTGTTGNNMIVSFGNAADPNMWVFYLAYTGSAGFYLVPYSGAGVQTIYAAASTVQNKWYKIRCDLNSNTGIIAAYLYDSDGVTELGSLVVYTDLYNRPLWSIIGRGTTVNSMSIAGVKDTDVIDVPFIYNSAGNWLLQNGGKYSSYCISSPVIPNNGTTTATLTATFLPGDIDFWWRMRSEQDCDFFTFSINGAVLLEQSGNLSSWHHFVHTIVTKGDYTLEWKYHKDSSYAYSWDCVYISDLYLPASLPPPVIVEEGIAGDMVLDGGSDFLPGTYAYNPTDGGIIEGDFITGGKLVPAVHKFHHPIGGLVITQSNHFVRKKRIPFTRGMVMGGGIYPSRSKAWSISGGMRLGGGAKIKPYNVIPNVSKDAVVVTIWTNPPLVYTLQDRVISIGNIRKPLGGVIGNLENANASFVLDNSDSGLTLAFSPPPLGVTVTLGRQLQDPIFTGLITHVGLGQYISVDLEAGERIPLSQSIPLHSTTEFSGYRTDSPIPVVYGEVSLNPLAMDSTGFAFVIASHPCEAVLEVAINNSPITGYKWENMNTNMGTIAVITLRTALLASERITCKVRGKQNPYTGGMMTNPADIIWDILANVCGISLSYDEVNHFRTDMQSKGYLLSGALVDGRKTIRTVIDEIMFSCGCIWSGQVEGIALDFLGAVPETPHAIITASQISDITTETRISEICTQLKMSYAYDYGQNQHTSVARFDCPISIQRYGTILTDVYASWLQGSRNIAIIGERYLQYKATPRWVITVTTGGEHLNISPGQWIQVLHPYLPNGDVTALCTDAELELITGTITLKFSIPADTVYPVVLSKLSSAFDPATLEGTQVQFANGQATLTFTNDKGVAMNGATVTLDGNQTLTTDAQGRVTFTTTRGIHAIQVVATGYQTMDGEIEI